MDILAARKKAAERAQAEKQAEPTRPPEARSREEAPRPDEPVSAPPEARAEAPAPAPAPANAPEAPLPEDALASDEAPTQTSEIELLAFRLGGEEYAVLVQDVREVLKIRDLTLVPNAPEFILGVTSLRGAMLPVIDLCKRFGLAPGVRDEKTRIVVVSPDEEDVGLMVDRVTGVLRIMPEAIKPAPENIEKGAEFLRGIARKDDKLYILLDLERAAGV